MIHVLSMLVLWEHMEQHGVIVYLVDDPRLIGLLMFSKVLFQALFLLPVRTSMFSTDSYFLITILDEDLVFFFSKLRIWNICNNTV